MKPHIAYLALGTNLGDKRRNLQTAIEHLAATAGTLLATSSVYTSEPWGYVSDNTYLNQVVKIETELAPLPLLRATQHIEQQMGRPPKRAAGYQDRLIDIDIILYDELTYHSDELTIPHPHYRQRPFVLEPLNEIL